MAENNQRDVDRLVADLSVSSTRSSRVRMVPAGGHFAQGDGAAAPAPTTVGGAAAGRRFRQRTAMDEEEPRPAGARFADSRPAGARFASAHVDEGHVDDGRARLPVLPVAGSRLQAAPPILCLRACPLSPSTVLLKSQMPPPSPQRRSTSPTPMRRPSLCPMGQRSLLRPSPPTPQSSPPPQPR